MTGEPTDLADKPVLIKPRTFVIIMTATLTAVISAYAWVFSTFVTQTQFQQHTETFDYHVEEATIWQIEARKEDVADLLWDLNYQMKQPGGDTQMNSTRKRELENREERYIEQIRCLKSPQGKHCLEKMDST